MMHKVLTAAEQLQKVVTRFDPPTTHPVSESGRHYVSVHVPLAASHLMRSPDRLAYYTSRARSQLTLTGEFTHRVEAWRYVTTYSRANSIRTGRNDPTVLPTTMRAAMERDVPNCLRNLRRCQVEERVLLARPGQRMGSVTYLFEYVADDADLTSTLGKRLTAIGEWVAQEADSYPPARGVVMDTVLSESEVEPIVEPGQAYTGRLCESRVVGFLWLMFDNWQEARKLFRRDDVVQVMLDGTFARVEGYEIDHECVFDRRKPA